MHHHSPFCFCLVYISRPIPAGLFVLSRWSCAISVSFFILTRYYGGIAASCILLLVVLFFYLGLAFGVCGDPPGEDAQACNRGVGSCILMTLVHQKFYSVIEH